MLIEMKFPKTWRAPEVRNKLQVSSRVHRGRRKLPTEIRQVLRGLSPEWGITSMTLGETRGWGTKSRTEPRRRRYQLRRLRGLQQRIITVTPGFTGGHHCFDPAILRDRLLRV
jgi:hypothetical protein